MEKRPNKMLHIIIYFCAIQYYNSIQYLVIFLIEYNLSDMVKNTLNGEYIKYILNINDIKLNTLF